MSDAYPHSIGTQLQENTLIHFILYPKSLGNWEVMLANCFVL